MQEITDKEKIEKLSKENRQLKLTNRILTAYVIATFLIMIYNYFAWLICIPINSIPGFVSTAIVLDWF